MTSILIANENSDIRELFAFVLSEHQQIINAEDGLQAIQLFDRYKPNIVIIHTFLPKISGYEVVKHMRARDLSVYIIATSSNCSRIYQDETILQAGANLCLPTPVDLNILRLTVQTIVEPQITFNNNETNTLSCVFSPRECNRHIDINM